MLPRHYDAIAAQAASSEEDRLIGVEIAAIAAEQPYGLRHAHELERGCQVKIGDEWTVFHRLDDDGRLVLTREGSACTWTYPPCLGEMFVWTEPF